MVLHKDTDSKGVVGKSIPDAQCILACKWFPLGNGGVKIELTPEIHHGQPKKQFVAGEGTFHLLAMRERQVFGDLLIATELAPGQTMVLSGTPQFGLGHSFFLERENGEPQQRLLLVRLAQTQRDDLFEELDGLNLDAMANPDELGTTDGVSP